MKHLTTEDFRKMTPEELYTEVIDNVIEYSDEEARIAANIYRSIRNAEHNANSDLKVNFMAPKSPKREYIKKYKEDINNRFNSINSKLIILYILNIILITLFIILFLK